MSQNKETTKEPTRPSVGLNDLLAVFVAKLLYNIGIKPKATLFIDGESVSYGYGKIDGNVGVWKFQLPNGYIKNR